MQMAENILPSQNNRTFKISYNKFIRSHINEALAINVVTITRIVLIVIRRT